MKISHVALSLAVILAMPIAARAEFTWGPGAITPTVGFGSGLAVGARMDIGSFSENFVLTGRFLYRRQTWSVDDYSGGYYGDPYGYDDPQLKGHVTTLSFEPGLTYYIPLDSERLRPFAEAGLGLGIVQLSGEAYGVSAGSVAGTGVTATIGGGIDYLLSNALLVGAHAGYYSDHGEIGAQLTIPFAR